MREETQEVGISSPWETKRNVTKEKEEAARIVPFVSSTRNRDRCREKGWGEAHNSIPR